MAKWQLDNAHSSADFTVRHMMVTNVRGTFGQLEGTIEFDPNNPEDTSVDVTIDVSTINTGAKDRDNHLRSPDFFNVEEYPEMTFKSTNVEVTGKNTAKLTGDLTIRDITKSVTLDVELVGVQENSPFGDTRAGFEATGKINREDWDLTWNQTLESGGVLVGRDVKINIDAQAVLVEEEESEEVTA